MLFAATLLALFSFIAALAFTPIVRNIFLKLGLVDEPTGGRKTHSGPIPRVGGIAIAASLALSIGATAALGVWEPFYHNTAIQFLIRLIPAAGIIFVVGLLDDLFNLKPWQKFLGQLLGACTAYATGLRVMGIAGHDTGIWLSLPLTIGWLLLCTNAFNLIDGVDGLAAGAGLFATLTILLVGILQHNNALVLASVPLGAALLGFLRYNFNPASVFLGDSGSLLLGFLLGCFGVVWSTKTTTILGMVAPLMALSVPLLDVALSVARRFLRGQPVFGADRGHVHHRLLDRGLTPRRVVLLLYTACAFGAVLSLVQSVQHNQYTGFVVLLFCAGAWGGIQQLGYTEFTAARNVLLGGAFQRMIHTQVQAREFETSLESCESFEEWWEQLCAHCRSMGFAAAELKSGRRIFEEKFAPATRDCWSVIIPMGDGISLHLSVPPNGPQTMPMIAPFAGFASRKLPETMRALRDGGPRVVAFGRR